MSVKLSKVTKELNVGLGTVVEYLHKNGFSEVADNNPNARISDEQYALLLKAFSKDKGVKKESEIVAQRHKERPKNESVVLDSYAQKVAESELNTPKEAPIQFKTVGKIDLDALNKKKATQAVVEPEVEPDVQPEQNHEPAAEPIVEPEPVVEQQVASQSEPEPQPVAEPVSESVSAQSSEESTNTKSDEVFTYGKKNIQSSINVVGKIDLSQLNQQTRPKKKTKEEKRKEREEKYTSKNNSTASNAASGNADDKKKRNKIQRERVDINKPFEGKKGGKSGKNDRGRRTVEHTQPDEEAVQRQVRETLAMLTNKQKSKGAKYRKDKREAASQRMQEEAELERLENQTIKITEFVTVNELASMMDVPVTKVIGTCMSLGLMVSINQRLDAETINIVADEFGFKTEYVSAEVSENLQEEDAPEDLVPRAPIVTVMGHVDHGKTSLLDYIRKANVIAGEAGGITQHIGAYNVTLESGQHITFLDTPGHEAFTAMRARGAQITDVAIIIVAADDSIMPQTVEAIHHAAAANVPIVFAINKIDKPTANPDKIKEALAGMNYLVEEWGGKYQSQDISAKKGIGINELLEKVLLEAEMLDLKANPHKNAVGSVIESSLDKGRGYLATVLVEGGTLHQGDVIVSGTHFGRVKAMFNERNQRVQEVKPGEPVLLLGLNGAPQAGEKFNVMNTEQEAREIANKREQLKREQSIRTKKHLTLDELGRRIALGNFQELNVIVKGDVDGSIEALADSLIKLSTPEIQVNVIHKAVGAISESDVLLAAASNAIIVGFQVRPSVDARRLAEKEEVDIRLYSIIYDAIEQIKDAMEGMLSPEIKEEVTATLEVLDTFKITKVGTVAGCLVREGKVKRSNKLRLIRDGIVVFSGELGSLKRMKDDVKEVATGFECGLNIANYNDVRVGDFIETFEEIEVKRTF